MKNIKNNFLVLLFLSFYIHSATAQNLDSLMAAETGKPEKEFSTATFKGTKLINGHTVETPGKNVLQFMILHRFGVMRNGIYDMFGLDQATIRLGLDYGITNRLAIGVGRNTVNKAVDGYVKVKLLRQAKGSGASPVTATFLMASTINTIRFPEDGLEYVFRHRMFYTTQLLLARKFSSRISLQLMPSVIHRNLVDSIGIANTVFALGAGGRVKITKRFALTGEYYYVFPNQLGSTFVNTVSAGFEIETGGHVFQIHLTNAYGMAENQFIAETVDSWADGNFRLGFNVSRVFALGKKDKK